MPLPRVEAANALPLLTFTSQFLPTSLPSLQFEHAQTLASYHITLESSSTLTSTDFTACFGLIATTSASAYSGSSIGWSPAKKSKEMRLPDLRYLIVKSGASTAADKVEAFLSFMITYEDGHEVVYCYEIHLSGDLQGCGLGRHLMGIMEELGRKVGVEKAMLTVFLENEGALRFYERLGYVEDEYSPRPRKLRNGVVKKPDYIILSKQLER
ncbi:gnat family acetyltransferase [Lasallia pustulata]|uniref:N-alpha-acetyltransferase 40 n=1 Tax=Lasallia pustulata TaxID=136370 RepID=A0A1W5D5V0_9LECA|nr:gnat family acetyltransferase [Lasallia pustulata]